MSATITLYDKDSPADMELIKDVSELLKTIVPETTMKSFSRELLKLGVMVYRFKQSLSGQQRCYFESLIKSIKLKNYRISKDGKSLTFPIT